MPPETALALGKRSQFKPVDPAQFLSTRYLDARTDHPPARPDPSAPRDEPDMRSTPQQRHVFNQCHPSLFPARSGARRVRSRRADKPFTRCLRLAGGVVVLEPFWERPAGPKHTRAEQDRKLGQLRYARQELVRVPESNTKYGGKWGITGGRPAPVVEPSISESSGIPNRKNLHLVVPTRLHPAVHRAGIFLHRGIASAETHVGLRKVRAGMPAAVVVARESRQAEPRILPDCPHA